MSIPWQLLCSIILASLWGIFILLFSFSSSLWGVFILLLSFSLSWWGVFLLLLSYWGYEGHGEIAVLATLCFFGHSSLCCLPGPGCFITGGGSPDKCQDTVSDGLFSSSPSWFQSGCLGWCGTPPPFAPTGSCSTMSTALTLYAAAVPVSAPLPAPVGPTPLPVN
jgi:hypothetical protein